MIFKLFLELDWSMLTKILIGLLRIIKMPILCLVSDYIKEKRKLG